MKSKKEMYSSRYPLMTKKFQRVGRAYSSTTSDLFKGESLPEAPASAYESASAED
jgi:hypothetical protein